MKSKPKFHGVSISFYENLSKCLEDDHFKLKILFISGVVKKLNEMNIKFQDHHLEINHLLAEMQNRIRDFARLTLKNEFIKEFFPKNPGEFLKSKWEDVQTYKEKYLPYQEFIFTLITDQDKNLLPLENLQDEQKKKFAEVFQPFLAKIISRLVFYFPVADELVNTLDFVTLDRESDELKKKILAFNKQFNIIPFDQINALSKEISFLTEINLLLLRKEAKKSSLYLWDLIKQMENNGDEMEAFPLLNKIFQTAHALPTSSSGVEQSFSSMKLIKSAIRNRLHEETVQSLMMICEEHRENGIIISEEMVQLYEQQKEELRLRKSNKKEEPIVISLSSNNNKISEICKKKDEVGNSSRMEIESEKVAVDQTQSQSRIPSEKRKPILDGELERPNFKKLKMNNESEDEEEFLDCGEDDDHESSDSESESDSDSDEEGEDYGNDCEESESDDNLFKDA